MYMGRRFVIDDDDNADGTTEDFYAADIQGQNYLNCDCKFVYGRDEDSDVVHGELCPYRTGVYSLYD